MSKEQAGREETPVSATELRTVYHSVNDAIFIHDSDGYIIDVNRAAAEMYGYSRSELRDGDVGPISSGEPPYTDENANEKVRRAAAGNPQTFEWQGQDREGNVFWEEVSLSRTTVDGETRVLAIVRDIDDRKRAERRFQTLIDNLPGIVYRCRNEPGWPMLFVGGQSEALTGYSVDTIESDAVSWGNDLVHPEDRKWLHQAVDSAIASGEPYEVTYRIRTAEGETRWVWERGRQVDESPDSGTKLEGFITDITDRHRYEQQLEEQRDNLEILNQVVRHDIRNKLQLVLAYAQMVQSEGIAGEDEYGTQVVEAARDAIEITRTARAVTEVMLQSNVDQKAVELSSVLEEEVEKVQSNYHSAIVKITDTVPSVEVIADDMLSSVFRNLLVNAIQHNDKPIPEVTVSATNTDGTVHIRFADNGPGIKDEHKLSIFEKGEIGLDSEGTGLGLYLVDMLVDRYGGDVRVENNDPEGAVFVVELPIAE